MNDRSSCGSRPLAHGPWFAFALALSLLLASAPRAGASTFAGYQYLSPLPGSHGVSPLNDVVIRDGRDIDPASIGQASVRVAGSISGAHTGRLVLSDDRRSLVFNPDHAFAPGERVTVTLDRAPRTRRAEALPPVTFEFSVAMANPMPYRPEPGDDELGSTAEPTGSPAAEASAPLPQAQGDLPASYPPVTLLVSDHPAPGFVFCTPARNTPPASNTHMMILDNDAMPIFYRKTSSRPVDLKKLPDGRLVYFELGKNAGYALDGNYAVVDSFKMGNGYTADSHDILVLPNNHALLMAYDPQPVDMSVIVTGGNPNATVIGLVLQEIDEAKNVVWQWRSWDHLDITDLSAACAKLTDATIDYVHGNSFDLDLDGNLIVSGRYLNEFFKIDRQTGDVLWRCGPNAKRNQFTITGDSLGFSDQHDVRVLPNGHITLFDNHFCIDPKQTRVLEYELDEQNLTAHLVWAYRHTPDLLSVSGGGYQRFDDGGGIIGWANVTTPPHMTELHADGSVAWEVQFWAAPVVSLTYRAYRFPWRGTAFTTDVDSLDFGGVTVGDSALKPLVVTNNTALPITFTSFVSLDSAFSVVNAPPITVDAGGSVTVQAMFRPTHAGNFRRTLYVRSATATQLIAYPVTVTGHADVATATLMAKFEGAWTHDGVELSWEFGTPETFVSLAVERSENANGPWIELPGGVIQEGERMTLLDRGAVGGRSYFYRIVGTTGAGEAFVSQLLAVAAGASGSPRATLSVTPIPSRGATRIDFTVSRDARVRLSVLDAQGRVVADLANGTRAAGEYHATWDGRLRSVPAPAGLYFVRYEGPDRNVVRRLVLMR
jgi:hypothetical protein